MTLGNDHGKMEQATHWLAPLHHRAESTITASTKLKVEDHNSE